MSSSPGAGYKLRPNKAVDRELFLSLLTRLSSPLKIETYQYIGLGGPFLEDFRMIHTRVGIDKMVCIDNDKQTHLRQKFNKPIDSVECIHATLENYIEETEIEIPTILWLDYTDPNDIQAQIEMFAQQVTELPINSILRITLNANPSSLGKPNLEDISVNFVGEKTSAHLPSEQEWRLDRFKERMAEYCPADVKPEDMKQKNYGKTLLQVLELSAEKAISQSVNRKLIWCFTSLYSDGQFMVTATVMIVENSDVEIVKHIEDWEYRSVPTSPHVIDLPSISTLERLIMESSSDPKSKLGYDLPRSLMKNNPFETFKKYYRVFPHFSRVEV
jgi:hypothetical protein